MGALAAWIKELASGEYQQSPYVRQRLVATRVFEVLGETPVVFDGKLYPAGIRVPFYGMDCLHLEADWKQGTSKFGTRPRFRPIGPTFYTYSAIGVMFEAWSKAMTIPATNRAHMELKCWPLPDVLEYWWRRTEDLPAEPLESYVLDGSLTFNELSVLFSMGVPWESLQETTC